MNNPDFVQHSVIHRAKILGTYGKMDRSAQYNHLDERYPTETLLKNDNVLFEKARLLEAEIVERSKFRHRLVLIVVAAVLSRAPEIYSWIAKLF